MIASCSSLEEDQQRTALRLSIIITLALKIFHIEAAALGHSSSMRVWEVPAKSASMAWMQWL